MSYVDYVDFVRSSSDEEQELLSEIDMRISYPQKIDRVESMARCGCTIAYTSIDFDTLRQQWSSYLRNVDNLYRRDNITSATFAHWNEYERPRNLTGFYTPESLVDKIIEADHLELSRHIFGNMYDFSDSQFSVYVDILRKARVGQAANVVRVLQESYPLAYAKANSST